MKTIRKAFVVLCLIVLVNGQGSLLEMSQQLWTKLLNGGFSKTGKLDPLKVPIVKVDQSEGDTSYRIILRNVEIGGLNDSTVESIHIARGRLKSNLSELEAGYVSYSDLRDLDSIRYRFHMLIKEPKGQNESFEAIVSASSQDNKFLASSKEQESHLERLRQYDPFLMKIQAEKMKQPADGSEKSESQESSSGRFSMEGARVVSRPDLARDSNSPSYPMDVQLMYAMSAINAAPNYRAKENYEASSGANSRDYRPYYDPNAGANSRNYQSRENYQTNSGSNARIYRPSYDSSSGSNSRDYQQDTYGRTRSGTYFRGNKKGNERESFDGEPEERFEGGQGQGRENFGGQGTVERYENVQTAASENVESKVKGQDQQIVPGYAARGQQGEPKGLEKQPGYIDIVYADPAKNGSTRRFGNERIESKEKARVYGVRDFPKDFLDNRRMFSYNCTEGEPLTKRNDDFKAALDAKSMDRMIRYANGYQEKDGYFEEGMQLVYHYGGMGANNFGGEKNVQRSRYKRAHRENHTDDDVMHVIMKIRVPLLRIKADYQLTGKVGKELVSGNGQLSGNFTELSGDFTIELKKTKDQDMLMVRAARSKLVAKDQDIDLQGMDEKGPVKSILEHGLMAAEAVAAMLADDLATKALNDKTADAMIYRMYKNLPVN
ncbi:uncharacterized protein LOC143149375 [Ptiloglossa arizonensis]|uniref:uncharacterized protein LOC143149375 n=1 Tax=Ptiloglossa arizonensis TaxID=3350558 RepID=UPI003FA18932